MWLSCFFDLIVYRSSEHVVSSFYFKISINFGGFFRLIDGALYCITLNVVLKVMVSYSDNINITGYHLKQSLLNP